MSPIGKAYLCADDRNKNCCILEGYIQRMVENETIKRLSRKEEEEEVEKPKNILIYEVGLLRDAKYLKISN